MPVFMDLFIACLIVLITMRTISEQKKKNTIFLSACKKLWHRAYFIVRCERESIALRSLDPLSRSNDTSRDDTVYSYRKKIVKSLFRNSIKKKKYVYLYILKMILPTAIRTASHDCISRESSKTRFACMMQVYKNCTVNGSPDLRSV